MVHSFAWCFFFPPLFTAFFVLWCGWLFTASFIGCWIFDCWVFLIGVLSLWVCSFWVFYCWVFLILCDSNDLVWLWFLSIVLWCLLPLFSNNWYHSLLQYHDCIICWLGFRIEANIFLVFQFSAVIFLHNCVYHGLWFRHGLIFMVLI